MAYKRSICGIHKKKRPCLSCRAARAGEASSPKKTLANRKKAKLAAMKRWHPELFLK